MQELRCRRDTAAAELDDLRVEIRRDLGLASDETGERVRAVFGEMLESANEARKLSRRLDDLDLEVKALRTFVAEVGVEVGCRDNHNTLTVFEQVRAVAKEWRWFGELLRRTPQRPKDVAFFSSLEGRSFILANYDLGLALVDHARGATADWFQQLTGKVYMPQNMVPGEKLNGRRFMVVEIPS